MLEKGAMDVPITPGMTEEGTEMFDLHSVIRFFSFLPFKQGYFNYLNIFQIKVIQLK